MTQDLEATAALTPQELHALVDEKRRALHLPWWRVAVQIDVAQERLRAMRRGDLSARLRARVEAWLGPDLLERAARLKAEALLEEVDCGD